MSPTAPAVETLDRLLPATAARRPECGISIHERRGAPARRTWPELEAAVRLRAARLAGLGLEPGEALPIALDTSFELIESWLAAVALGARPVALAPLGAVGTGAAQIAKVEGVLERLEARLLIAPAALRGEAERADAPRLAAAVRTEEDLAAAPAADPPARAPDPDAVAFFQLTSGSTGAPRAVSVPHRAALSNLAAIEAAIDRAFGRSVREHGRSVVSWLPLHHDMGLVGCLLATLRSGLDLHLLSPRVFLARPETWLRALSAAGPAVSSAPNFGYQTCLEREPKEALALGDWHTALVGAEMVREETMQAFAARFAPYGFDGRALRPCYGLAEATLAVSFDVAGEGPRFRDVPAAAGAPPRRVACLGHPVADTELRVVAPDGTTLGEDAVGELLVRGPGLFAGYHRDPEATAAALDAGWLRTGDLAFLHDGELYLTGRIKEILILRGQNWMPHELESCAEAEAGAGGTSRAGAFSVDRGAEGEQAVIALEVASDDAAVLATLERGVRVRIGRALGLPLADVVLLRRGRIPKTTSGKVQRGELRRRYLAGELERLNQQGSGA